MTINKPQEAGFAGHAKRKAVGLSGHARERMREYGFTMREIHQLCDGLDHEAVRAVDGGAVLPGRPVHIGTQQGRHQSADSKDVFLSVTRQGRPCIIVTTQPKASRYRCLITLWDPACPENRQYWRNDFTAPTPSGVRILPPTTWFGLMASAR